MHFYIKKTIAFLTATFLLLAAQTSAYAKGDVTAKIEEQQVANGLAIFPTRLIFDQRTRTTTFTVTNKSDKPGLVSAKAFKWIQADGNDKHIAARDVIVNPPVAKIKPNGEQKFRVGLRRAPDRFEELSYRIHLREVPQGEAVDQSGPRILVGFWLPIFVKPVETSLRPNVTWEVTKTYNNGAFEVLASNSGNAHIRTRGIMLMRGDKPLAQQGGVHYVLPNSQRLYLADRAPKISSTNQKPNRLVILYDSSQPDIIDLDAVR